MLYTLLKSQIFAPLSLTTMYLNLLLVTKVSSIPGSDSAVSHVFCPLNDRTLANRRLWPGVTLWSDVTKGLGLVDQSHALQREL